MQRKVTLSLGRRSYYNLSSDASWDSNPWDKRLCVKSSVAVEVLSSPPRTSTPGVQSSQSRNSDTASGTLEKPVPRRFLKQEFVPPRNRLVYILVKKLVQAEVFTCHPWPNTSIIESLVRRCWTNAIKILEEERSEIYPVKGQRYPKKLSRTVAFLRKDWARGLGEARWRVQGCTSVIV